jgi:hypothetical protein
MTLMATLVPDFLCTPPTTLAKEPLKIRVSLLPNFTFHFVDICNLVLNHSLQKLILILNYQEANWRKDQFNNKLD